MVIRNKNPFLTLFVLIIILFILWFIKIAPKAKIIYGSLLALIIVYLLNREKIMNALDKMYRSNSSKKIDYYYSKYEEKYRKKHPGTLEFIASRNLGFIPIYYINMKRSKERRYAQEKELGKYGLSAERVEGIDGKLLTSLTEGELGGIKYKSIHSDLSSSELACTLSHLKAIQKAHDDGHQLALIAEDDLGLDLVPHWENTLHQIIDTFPPDWEIVNLSSNCSADGLIDSYENQSCTSTIIYIINRLGMKHILDLKKDGVFHLETPKYGKCKKGYADCYLYTVIPGGYSYNESLFFSRPFDSNISQGSLGSSRYSWNKIKKFAEKEILKN